MDNQLKCSPLGRRFLLHPLVPVVLSRELSSSWLFPHIAISMSVIVLVQTHVYRNSMSVASDSHRKHNITANFLILWLLQSFTPSSTGSLSFRCRSCSVVVSVVTRLHDLFWLVVVFCNDLCLEQENFVSHVSKGWEVQHEVSSRFSGLLRALLGS